MSMSRQHAKTAPVVRFEGGLYTGNNLDQPQGAHPDTPAPYGLRQTKRQQQGRVKTRLRFKFEEGG